MQKHWTEDPNRPKTFDEYLERFVATLKDLWRTEPNDLQWVQVLEKTLQSSTHVGNLNYCWAEPHLSAEQYAERVANELFPVEVHVYILVENGTCLQSVCKVHKDQKDDWKFIRNKIISEGFDVKDVFPVHYKEIKL